MVQGYWNWELLYWTVWTIAKERGFNRHMLKPLDLDILGKKLAELKYSPAHWSKP